MAVALLEQAYSPAGGLYPSETFSRYGSNVRWYCRKFPSVYVTACSATIVVLKLLPPLTMGDDELELGLEQLEDAIADVA